MPIATVVTVYPLLADITSLLEQKLVSRRPHPSLPLFIFNYTASAQGLPISQWSTALQDCRGLILDEHGVVIGRGFKKFWSYAQVLDQIPNEPFDVLEKLDGSLVIVCNYNGQRIIATRGSFESDQAKWASKWFAKHHPDFLPTPGVSWLFEGIFPANRIVVDYGDTEECVLLDVLDTSAVSIDSEPCAFSFRNAHRYDGITDFNDIDSNPALAGQEGFVVRYQSGLRCKIKLEEYKRLHRLITQCSTRTIWELLKTGKNIDELMERVPDDFRMWVMTTGTELLNAYSVINLNAVEHYVKLPSGSTRKEFAIETTKLPAPFPQLMFAYLDKRYVSFQEIIWKFIEPKWATPFRKEPE